MSLTTWVRPPCRYARWPVSLVGFLVAALCAVLGLLTFRRRSAAFMVDRRTPAFRTPPHAGHVYLVLTILGLTTATSPPWLSLSGGEEITPLEILVSQVMNAGIIAPYAAVLALNLANIVAAWRRPGVQLRPDGLIDRKPFGTLAVPWEALAPGRPREIPPMAGSLYLTYARPELVRCRRRPCSGSR